MYKDADDANQGFFHVERWTLSWIVVEVYALHTFEFRIWNLDLPVKFPWILIKCVKKSFAKNPILEFTKLARSVLYKRYKIINLVAKKLL